MNKLKKLPDAEFSIMMVVGKRTACHDEYYYAAAWK